MEKLLAIMSRKKQATESVEDLTLARVESPDALVVGTTQLFEGGQIRYIPMPTPDPKGRFALRGYRNEETGVRAPTFNTTRAVLTMPSPNLQTLSISQNGENGVRLLRCASVSAPF
jgi:hypothetical protein